ncbi:MAG: archaellin/type IV pilin N-terminal domain-containing protein [Nitrososphaerota archaeon]|nr:hypothetical protein [Candidatus Bathyarchaeota archaeon]MDW8023092.1 archaellin/type IV pilin N-terminal domain-containing protein [Nitrososphaerota archaeon]
MGEKPNIKCQKCGHEWHTKSKLKMVTCPSCNQKIPNVALKRRRLVKAFVQSRGIIGLEAAIVLIAFVIIAAAFSFMVVNQGLYATERGKVVIQEGLKQASTPLTIDGTTFVRTTAGGNTVNVIIVPVKAFGVKFVAFGRSQTVITLRVGEMAWANVYCGVLYNSTDVSKTYDPSLRYENDTQAVKFDDFVGFRYNSTAKVYVNGTYGDDLITGAVLAIANSNGDEALDSGEKGYLIVTLSDEDVASARTAINIEIRLDKSATLSIEITIPESMPPNTYVPII